MEFNDTYSHVHFLLEGEIDVLIFFKYIFFPAKETMRITSLSNETFDNLASVLDKDSTIGWKKLMREGFSHIYVQKHIEEIEQISGSSAKALLNDLDAREESLENLIGALDRIGNKRTISIIQNGSCHLDRTFKTGQNSCNFLFLL